MKEESDKKQRNVDEGLDVPGRRRVQRPGHHRVPARLQRGARPAPRLMSLNPWTYLMSHIFFSFYPLFNKIGVKFEVVLVKMLLLMLLSAKNELLLYTGK